MDRLVILLEEPASFASTLLTRAALDAVRERTDIKVVGICVRRPKSYHRLTRRHLQNAAKRTLNHWLGQPLPVGRVPPWPLNLPSIGRRDGFPVLSPPQQNLNHPDFIAQLRASIHPTMALTFVCSQRYERELLKTLGYSVNYHNGILPGYRGVYTTSWSIYRRACETGFTFHRMDERLDTGPILHTVAVPVGVRATILDLEWEKALAATRYLPRLLEKMVHRDPGVPQQGEGRYYSKRDGERLRTIAQPSSFTADELARRLQAFASLWMRLDHRWFAVTKLDTPTGSGRFCFESADGVRLCASRVHVLKRPPSETR